MKRRPTTQDVTWFLDLHNNGQLNLDPPYQRRSVWTRKDKVFFLDTIFKSYPCPAVFLHKTTDKQTGKATYHVVDGKQRLEAIINFSLNKMAMPRDHTDLNLQGKKFKDLSEDYKQKFWDYVIAVDMLDIIEQTIVDEVFDRLNRNSRKLERQELRHAKYDGWLITLAEKESENQDWKDLNIATTSRARRMKDVQFISELIICALTDEVQGFSQDGIDEYYAMYEMPEEDVLNFNADEVEQRFSDLKHTIIAINNINQCLSIYAKSFMHFYTFWTFIIKHQATIDPSVIAPKYTAFMEKNIAIKREDISDDQQDPAMIYAANSVGANTDLSQRKARLNALEKVLLQ